MKVCILSLGEIITPNMMAGVKALSEKTGIPMKRIGEILQEERMGRLIAKFKLGQYEAVEADEEKQDVASPDRVADAFCDAFVQRLNDEACQSIAREDFQEAWSAMNPSYERYASLLEEAMAFNNLPDQRLILIGYTNYLDVSDMQKYGVMVDPQSPCTLNDIAFHASYNEHVMAPELLKRVIQNLIYPNPENKSALFGNQREKFDITWVYTSKDGNEARARFGTVPDLMLEMCDSLGVNARVWDKGRGMTLTEALQGVPVSVAALDAVM